MAKSTTGKNTDRQDYIDRFDQLISKRNIENLLPFLQNEADIRGSAFKKHVLKSRRYWNTFVEYEKEELKAGQNIKWGARGDETQLKIVNLTALTVLNSSDTTNFSNEILTLRSYPTSEHVRSIVAWAKPAWIARAIEDSFDKSEGYSFDYQLLRTLETDGILTFSPRLFALSLGSPRWFRQTKEKHDWLDYLSTDATVLERDLPLLFEYETRLHDRWTGVEMDGRQYQLWEFLFQKFLAEGRLHRSFFIEQSLRIQTKNWNNAVKLFFRNRIDEADPGIGELIEHQFTLFSFLHESYPQVVNYGIEKIRQIHQHPDFDLQAWLDWLPPMLMRQDAASSVKKVLQLFDYFFKTMPERREDLLVTIADIFVVPNLELQQQAARRILKNGKDGDIALCEKLKRYCHLMLGNISQEMSPILGDPEVVSAAVASEDNYRLQGPEYRLLEEKIVLPENWNEVMFLISRYLSSREPLDAELILNTYQTRSQLFPADSQEQLKPFLKQIGYWKNPGHVSLDNLMNGFLLRNPDLLRQLNAAPETGVLKTRFHAPLIFKNLMRLTQRKMKRQSTLPLLCFPTHQPYWVAPEILMQRLIDYQTASEHVDWLDLTIAISRMPREETSKAVKLLPKLALGLRALLEFCLGTSKQIYLNTEKWQSKLLSLIGRTGEDTAQVAAWAVAARTFYPDECFPEFEKTSLAGAPNVVEPFSPRISFVRHPKREITPAWSHGQPVSLPAYTDLNVTTLPNQAFSLQLLYSGGLFRKSSRYEWFWESVSENELTFLQSLVPQNPDPLIWHCILTRSGFNTFLDLVRRPEHRWTQAGILAFCTAFYNDNKPVRFQAGEVLHDLIEENRLETDRLGRQLGHFVYGKFSVLKRLLESLEGIRGVSAKHDAALFEILDNLFTQFYENKKSSQEDTLPVHFKKLVEYYVDLQVKTRRKISDATLDCFQYLEENAGLKKLVLQIKSARK